MALKIIGGKLCCVWGLNKCSDGTFSGMLIKPADVGNDATKVVVISGVCYSIDKNPGCGTLTAGPFTTVASCADASCIPSPCGCPAQTDWPASLTITFSGVTYSSLVYGGYDPTGTGISAHRVTPGTNLGTRVLPLTSGNALSTSATYEATFGDGGEDFIDGDQPGGAGTGNCSMLADMFVNPGTYGPRNTGTGNGIRFKVVVSKCGASSSGTAINVQIDAILQSTYAGGGDELNAFTASGAVGNSTAVNFPCKRSSLPAVSNAWTAADQTGVSGSSCDSTFPSMVYGGTATITFGAT